MLNFSCFLLFGLVQIKCMSNIGLILFYSHFPHLGDQANPLNLVNFAPTLKLDSCFWEVFFYCTVLQYYLSFRDKSVPILKHLDYRDLNYYLCHIQYSFWYCWVDFNILDFHFIFYIQFPGLTLSKSVSTHPYIIYNLKRGFEQYYVMFILKSFFYFCCCFYFHITQSYENLNQSCSFGFHCSLLSFRTGHLLLPATYATSALLLESRDSMNWR